MFFGVTRLERLKGVKDKVKQTRWAQSRSGSGGPGSGVGGRGLGSGIGGPGSGSGRVRAGGLEVGAQRVPRLLVTYNCPV